MIRKWLVVVPAGCAIAAALEWQSSRLLQTSESQKNGLLATTAPANYVYKQLCLACPNEQASRCQQSNHAKSMAVVTAQTLLGDFSNAEFRHQRITSRFFRQGDKYFVHTDGPDGKLLQATQFQNG
jgi:hypothetical protein